MRVIALSVLLILSGGVAAQQTAKPQSGGLRIRVIEGEAAINIINRGTAVAPIVEVRDSNDLPVAGAIVRFTVRPGGSSLTFANGQTVQTVTTDATGRAAASGLTPVTEGKLQIDVEVQFQGQTATTSIAQSNVATAPAPGGAAATAGTIAAGAAAGLAGVLTVTNAAGEKCTTQADLALVDIDDAINQCVNNSESAQCNATALTARASLSEWCSCAGGAGVNAALGAQGSSLDQLEQAGAFVGVGLPPSCR